MRSDLKKLDSLTFEMSKNHLIRNFLRNGRLRVKAVIRFCLIIDQRIRIKFRILISHLVPIQEKRRFGHVVNKIRILVNLANLLEC